MSRKNRYISGMAKIHDCDDFSCDEDTGEHYGSDPDTVSLPHQCGSWVIGGREEVEAMIRDLQELLEKMRHGEIDPDHAGGPE